MCEVTNMKAATVWSLLLLAGSVTCTPVEDKNSLPKWIPDIDLEKPEWWPEINWEKPEWWPEINWEKPEWWPDSIPPHPEWVPDINWEKPDWWPDSIPPHPEWVPDIDWEAIPKPEYNEALRGTVATIEEFPSIVQIEIDIGPVWVQGCAGSVLTSRHILTCARCVSGRFYEARLRRIRAGSSTRSADGIITDVDNAVTPPTYGATVENFFDSDIAVVRLRSVLPLGSTIQQSPIVASGLNLFGGLPVKLAGWGTTAQGSKITDRDLYSVDLTSVDNGSCSDLWSSLIPIGRVIKVTPNMICAAIPETGGRDFDFRDIGAPIYYDNIIIGVASWGNPLGNQRFPVVATSVSSFTDWIVANAT